MRATGTDVRSAIIEIKILQHKETGRFFATSDDLKGLLVSARSVAEIKEQLPSAITELYEAHGKHVLSVIAEPTVTPSGFEETGHYRAVARLAA